MSVEAALEVIRRVWKIWPGEEWGGGISFLLFMPKGTGSPGSRWDLDWFHRLAVAPGYGEGGSQEEDPDGAVCAWLLLPALLAPAICRNGRLHYPTCGRWACSRSALPGSLLAPQNLRPVPDLLDVKLHLIWFNFVLFYFIFLFIYIFSPMLNQWSHPRRPMNLHFKPIPRWYWCSETSSFLGGSPERSFPMREARLHVCWEEQVAGTHWFPALLGRVGAQGWIPPLALPW